MLGTSQDSHWPGQSESQQIEPTQWLDEHSRSEEQAAPMLAIARQRGASHQKPGAQSDCCAQSLPHASARQM